MLQCTEALLQFPDEFVDLFDLRSAWRNVLEWLGLLGFFTILRVFRCAPWVFVCAFCLGFCRVGCHSTTRRMQYRLRGRGMSGVFALNELND